MKHEKAVKTMFERHDVFCNQKYDDTLPYSFHLKMVYNVCKRFIHLIPKELRLIVLLGAAGHDLIEDARMTYNDVRDKYGIEVAEIVYSCSDEKGKDRDGRHSMKFYNELKELHYNGVRIGVFVKMCDVIANGTYSRVNGSSMFPKYKRDLPKIKKLLYIAGEFDEVWDELELILK